MEYFHVNASAAGSWLVTTNGAFLDTININTSGAASSVAASQITVYNGINSTGGAGTVAAQILTTSNGVCLQYGRIRMENGIFVTLNGGTPDFTISFE